MKIKIKDLKANPFKKEINKGKLSEETINRIMSNMKELGLMGALPVFKKDDGYFLINGHHRLEALKRTYGKNFEVDVIVHNYTEDNVLRGMVVENLTQRNNEFREELENFVLIRKYLKSACSLSEQAKHKDMKGITDSGSIRDIAKWLNTSGEVIALGRISQILNIADNLDKGLLEKVKKGTTTQLKNQGDILPVKDALCLSKIEDKEEQRKLAKIIINEGSTNQTEREKQITAYKKAPEEVKEKIIKGEVKISNVEEAVIEHQIKQSNKGEHTEFIPNFETRLKDFGYNVAKLEQQVAIFRKVFGSNNFYSKYKLLGKKEKGFLNNSIYDIRKRIKKCYNEVEFFISKIEDKRLLGVKK